MGYLYSLCIVFLKKAHCKYSRLQLLLLKYFFTLKKYWIIKFLL